MVDQILKETSGKTVTHEVILAHVKVVNLDPIDFETLVRERTSRFSSKGLKAIRIFNRLSKREFLIIRDDKCGKKMVN